MKSDKIILILIITIMLCIGGIFGFMFAINKNDTTSDDISQRQEGGAEFTIDELENVQFEIVNLDENMKQKIQYDSFIISIKEYMYKNGFIQASKLDCISSKQDGNKIVLEFKLDNPEETIIIAKINIVNFTYEFTDNY